MMVQANESIPVLENTNCEILHRESRATRSSKGMRGCGFLKEFLRRADAENLADHCHKGSNRGGVRALANLVQSSACIAHTGKP